MKKAKSSIEMQVETWLTKDRINRYSGILKLYARDKKLQLSQATKLKSVTSKKLAFLEADVKKHRELVENVINGNKEHILALLREHKDFYIALNHLESSEICAAIYQDNDVKRRFLDKLYYKKKRKLKKTVELQLDHSVLSNDYEEQRELQNCELQQLTGRLEQFIAKYNAAKAMHSTYCSMLNILKKDTIFFDVLLKVLKEDQFSQCKVMLKVTIMGQLAAENLDDVKQKYKRMTRVVLRNMRIREHMLGTARCQVEDLWAYAQSLVRVDIDTVYAKKDIDELSTDKILENQLVHLTDICGKVKEALLVYSYYDLLSRLENQSKQKTNLLNRLSTNLKNRDTLLSQKNEVLQVLEAFDHSAKATAEQYKTNGQDILQQLEVEKKRKENLKDSKKVCGDLLTKIRAALQSMNTMLLCVKHSGKGAKKLPKNENNNMLKELDDKDESVTLPELEEMETDALVLLSKVCRKISTLFGMSSFDLEKEKNDKARDLYQIYVSNYSSNLKFGSGEEEPAGLFVEHEIVDVNILTRADIKFRSRQIIDAHLKLE